MLKWDKSIIGYINRQATRFLWSCPAYEVDDLLQEGWLVFDRLSKSYGREELIAHHGPLDDHGCRHAWMALFKTALRNRFLNIVRSSGRRESLESEERQRVRRDSGACSRGAHSIRAVEIACDLERAPGIRRILATASWDDDVVRIREPRTLKSGETETRADVLRRLVGRRRVGDFDAQLSMVV